MYKEGVGVQVLLTKERSSEIDEKRDDDNQKTEVRSQNCGPDIWWEKCDLIKCTFVSDWKVLPRA